MIPIGKINLYGKVDVASLAEAVTVGTVKNKEKILGYLRQPQFNSSYTTARVFDYFQNAETDIPMVGRHDDIYYWDDRDIYYLEKYNIEPKEEFIQHILKTFEV